MAPSLVRTTEVVIERTAALPEALIASTSEFRPVMQAAEAITKTISEAQPVIQATSSTATQVAGAIKIVSSIANTNGDINSITGTQLLQYLHNAKSIEEKHNIFLKVRDVSIFEERISQLRSIVSDVRPGDVYAKLTYTKLVELEENLPKLWDQITMRTDDIAKISKNIEIPEHIIQRIKEHVFLNEHLLDRGFARFDPDIDMLQAWERLIDGNYVQSDLRLLQHELAESLLMQGNTSAYRPAHAIVNEVYNWENFFK